MNIVLNNSSLYSEHLTTGHSSSPLTTTTQPQQKPDTDSLYLRFVQREACDHDYLRINVNGGPDHLLDHLQVVADQEEQTTILGTAGSAGQQRSISSLPSKGNPVYLDPSAFSAIPLPLSTPEHDSVYSEIAETENSAHSESTPATQHDFAEQTKRYAVIH